MWKFLRALIEAIFVCSRTMVELFGSMIIMMLLIAGIAHLPIGIQIGASTGDMSKLAQGNMPWFLAAILIIFMVGIVVLVIRGVIVAVKSAHKERNVIKWLIKN